jgi:ectoine hydroxylase-related dioxygenase (phytanoyl-CoA dioxygenase family)
MTSMSRSEVDQLPQDSPLTGDQLRQLDADGFLVLPGVLSESECGLWTEVIDELWKQESVKPHTYDDEPGVRFVENLLQHSAMFERCICDPRVVAAVRSVLGPEIALSLANARSTDPGFGNQALHELDRRRGKPFAACDAIWCLDEFTSDNGTRVLPGSHLRDDEFLAAMTDPLAPHPAQRVVAASRGSVLIFSTALIHAGQANGSDRPRRSMLTQFVVSGRRTRFDWMELPLHIRDRLSAESRDLLRLSR